VQPRDQLDLDDEPVEVKVERLGTLEAELVRMPEIDEKERQIAAARADLQRGTARRERERREARSRRLAGEANDAGIDPLALDDSVASRNGT